MLYDKISCHLVYVKTITNILYIRSSQRLWDSIFKSSVVAEQDFCPELLRQESNTKVGAGVITGGRRTELTGVGQRETTSEVGPTRKGLYSSLPAWNYNDINWCVDQLDSYSFGEENTVGHCS